MNPKILTKPLFIILVLSIINTLAFSQNTNVHIDEKHINIDSSLGLILINESIEKLNNSHPHLKASISSNGIHYSFSTPVSELKIGQRYELEDAHNNHYQLYFTQLPIIHINSSQPIIDEQRVTANFSICESNGNTIESILGIEYRGASSQSYPKKSFRLEFWKDIHGEETRDVHLLGMRSDDDWNLQAMYNEPIRIRSKVSFELWRKIDTLHYNDDEPKAINGVRQEYAELFLNNDYQGIYLLSERVDRKQLQLNKFDNGKIKGELYKGIGWGQGTTTLTYLPMYDNTKELWDGFEYKYPQENINWSNLYDWIDFVINTDDASFFDNYQPKFDIDNAINYFLFLNLLRSTDNTGKNLFIAKYSDGTPYFYVPWDLDGSFGIIWNGNKENVTEGILMNGFYKRLIYENKENGFVEKLKNRWNELRSNVLSKENLLQSFNKEFQFLKENGVYERELMAWEAGFLDYSSITYTYDWLQRRLIYLDNAFNNHDILVKIEEENQITMASLKVYPNPASRFLYFEITNGNHALEQVSICDYLGRPVKKDVLSESSSTIDIADLSDGLYFVIADFKNGMRRVEKIVIKK